MLLFTTDFRVDRTNNVSERGARGRQATPGRPRLLAFPRRRRRWCRIRSYLDSATAYGITAIDAIRTALERSPAAPDTRRGHGCQRQQGPCNARPRCA